MEILFDDLARFVLCPRAAGPDGAAHECWCATANKLGVARIESLRTPLESVELATDLSEVYNVNLQSFFARFACTYPNRVA